MNNIIKQLTTHTSIRNYTTQTIEDSIIKAIFQATQQAPTWINGQQLSIIRVTNSEVRAKLQQLTGNQRYVGAAPEFWVFCLDFYRTKKALAIEGKPFRIADNLDLLFVGTTDVGIALGTAVVAAESFGLGTVAIGGVRRNPQAVSELLQLPEYVYPVSGLCIGYPDETPALKPRLPKDAIIFENEYNDDIDHHLHTYNETIAQYMYVRTEGKSNTNWTTGVANFYSDAYLNSYESAEQALKKQHFLF